MVAKKKLGVKASQIGSIHSDSVQSESQALDETGVHD
jgi:hypothetical protein